MITEIITTGTELLLGEIDNENSRYLAELMNEHGFTVAFMTTVGDNPERMRAAFETALSRADLVITSGGLGSTQGDITKRIGAEALGLSYELFPKESERLAAYYKEKGRPYRPSLSRQAWFAKGAQLLTNEVGSASGSALENHGKFLIHLPGPPFEMKMMAEKHMLPWLMKRLGKMGTIRSMILPIPDRTEAEIEETIMDLIQAQENPTIALLARPGYIALRVTAKAETAEAAYALMSPLVTELRKRLPVSDYHIEQHVREDLVSLLEETHLSVSAAESCTGGLIGKLMTDLPGSSAYFKGSAVTYWNEAKEKVLGVSAETLSRYTAVSGETAKRWQRAAAGCMRQTLPSRRQATQAREEGNAASPKAPSSLPSRAVAARRSMKNIFWAREKCPLCCCRESDVLCDGVCEEDDGGGQVGFPYRRIGLKANPHG